MKKNKNKNLNFLEQLYLTIENRAKNKSKKSYTSKLLLGGKNKIAQKFGEEASEVIVDYLKGSKKRTIEEVSDLIYHLLVLIYSKKIKIKDIEKELNKRKNVRQQ